MSISTIQKKRKTKEFSILLARKGIEPNNFELNKMLMEHFDNHVMGMPYYAPIKQTPYEESSKKDYNHNFKTFQEDIETIYQANIEANNTAVAMEEYYDSEKNKVMNAIEKLALRVENIREALKTTNRVKQYVEVFDNVYGLEFYGNDKRNIPYTTAFIDLLQKVGYNEKMNAKVNKLNISNATISIDGDKKIGRFTQDGPIKNILSDITTDICILAFKSDTDGEKTLELKVDLGSIMTFNSVFFRFTSATPMVNTLSLSDDGENFVKVYDITTNELAEWTFTEKNARYIKITCTKTEPDGFVSGTDDIEMYEYYYIFKNISIARETYTSTSVIVSKVIDFDDLTSIIRLDATDMIFAHTRIDYFIGFDNGTDKIGWDAIENHKDHPLYMFEKRHKIANVHLSEFGSTDGIINAYALMELPVNVNLNSIKVTPGYNMWSVYRYKRKAGDSNEDGFSIIDGDFSNHIKKCDRDQMFMDCENYDGFQIMSNVLYTFTQYVSLAESANLYNAFIKVMDLDCKVQMQNAEIRVFLNGYEVTAGDNSLYSFGLHKGVNKIQIVIHCPSNTASDYMLYHNLNFKALTNDVFSAVPMKYTSNAIMDKVVGKTYDYYTIRNNTIYVKCDPRDMVHSELEDMAYFVTFSCLRTDLTGFFPDNHLKFRIMAVLNSSDKNLSPRLVNFRLTGR